MPERGGGAWLIPAASLAIVVGLLGLKLPEYEPGSPPPPGTGVEYDLTFGPGDAYDLDRPPVPAPPALRPGARGFERPDVYRADESLSGWDATGDRRYSVVGQATHSCSVQPVHQGGRVFLDVIRVGTRICVRTHQKHWALLVVTRSGDPLQVHVYADQ